MLFSEILMAEQLARSRLARALPKGMELSHFSVLNHLAHLAEERSPTQLARIFHVTRILGSRALASLHESVGPFPFPVLRRLPKAPCPLRGNPTVRRFA
jgi:hypothetical protein